VQTKKTLSGQNKFLIFALTFYTELSRKEVEYEKRGKILLLFLLAASSIMWGCSRSRYEIAYTDVSGQERIQEDIPEWVEQTEWSYPLYAYTSSDLQDFDPVMQDGFPYTSASGWSQEQSDAVYLGQGIEIFRLDGSGSDSRLVYYPMVYHGVIIYSAIASQEKETGEVTVRALPFSINEMNELMQLISEQQPLMLGVNNNNLIAIIGNTCYDIEQEYKLKAPVDLDAIPEIDTANLQIINAMEAYVTDRKFDMSNWVTF
jgi:hypothetical protein